MNAIVAQCGGPTPVINASLAAVIKHWQELHPPAAQTSSPVAYALYGSRYGLQGLLHGDWAGLSGLSRRALAQLARQPAAALGGSRFRPSEGDFSRIVANLQAAAINAVFLIGGNGTMAAAQRLAAEAQRSGVPLQVIGIPKTIDNDLAGCEATPGYGSAARYIAYTTQEIGLDLRAMRGFDQVAVVEVMGRHSGWLAAAAALARRQPDDPPHLILLPETPVEIDAVLERIAAVFAHQQVCTVVVAEGVHSEQDGQRVYWAELLGSAGLDGSGQRVFSMSAGAGAYLVQQVQERLGLRCRQIKLNTAQRSTRLLASPIDRRLAALVGAAAVEAWAQGASGVLPAPCKVDGEWQTKLIALAQATGGERMLPAGYLDAADFDVTAECCAYIAALVGPPPPSPLLWIE